MSTMTMADLIYNVDELFLRKYNKEFNRERLEEVLAPFVEEYGESEVLTACRIACNGYKTAPEAVRKIGGILHNRNKLYDDLFR